MSGSLNEELASNKASLAETLRLTIEQKENIEQLSQNENRLQGFVDQQEKTIQMLQNSLVRESRPKSATKSTANEPRQSNSSDEESLVVVSNEDVSGAQDLDGVMRIAQLQMEIKNLEECLENARKTNDFKSMECDSLVERLNEKSALVEQLEQIQKRLERSVKEQEMQNKLLNELREKDTKQHIKALTDLDLQLKKKSSDADKISHFLEQLRIKQERIQELESSLARVERQSNQERQTFDKQTHETWLNARKIEKDLKEARAECASLKDKLNEVEGLNRSLNESSASFRNQASQPGQG